MPRLATPHEKEARKDHPEAIERGQRQREYGDQQEPLIDRKGDAVQGRGDEKHRHRAGRAHDEAADGHPEQDRYDVHRRGEIELEVALTLLPPQLLGHHPDDVQPERGHRPTEHDEADVFGRRLERPVDEHECRRREERQEDLEEDPALLAEHAGDAWIGATADGPEIRGEDLAWRPVGRLLGARRRAEDVWRAHTPTSSSSRSPESCVGWLAPGVASAGGPSVSDSVSSKPRPTSSTKTSSSDGSDLRSATMCDPRPPSAPTTAPSAASSARVRLTTTVC